jgi:membrane peptidoglycan carboxypeptidase
MTSSPDRRPYRKRLIVAASICLVFGAIGILWVSHRFTATFEAREQDATSRLLGREYPLAEGTPGSARELAQRLDRLGYRRVRGKVSEPGSYATSGDRVDAALRGFHDLSGDRPATIVRVRFDEGRIAEAAPMGGLLEPETIAVFQGPNLEERDIVQVADCPKSLIDAVLAAEDRRFFLHPGIDPGGVLRALWTDVTSASLTQGGSTLTQQLAKNLYFSGERTFTRKASEAFAAMVLEARYSKDRILRAYVNEIYLGQHGAASVKGFGRAARHYFGKRLQDLTLAESALLAGMIRAPGLYNPFLHPERARERRDAVLRAMKETGTITEAQLQSAEREKIRIVKPPAGASAQHGAYIADLLRQDLETTYGADFWKRRLRVHTSIDPVYQEAAESAVNQKLGQLERANRSLRHGDKQGPIQAALISMSLDDGSIVAMVGGRSFETSQFNRATSARRQPGSLFKPVVYLAGLTAPHDAGGPARTRGSHPEGEIVTAPAGGPLILPAASDRPEGENGTSADRPAKKRHRFHWWWQKPDPVEDDDAEETPSNEIPSLPLTAATILQDEPYEVQAGGKTWAPKNDDEIFRGPVTVQRALEESLNVPTARAAAAIGVPRIVATGRALGITAPLPEVPSLALGAADITPLEMATAFATIASGGRRRDAPLLLGVEGEKGKAGSSISGDAARATAIPADAAHLMTALLEGVLDRGTGRSARDLGFAGVAAGKTGTSDDGRDLWFCGYTPKVLTLVWVGFDDDRPTHLTGARAALPIWVDYIERIGADQRTPFESDRDLVWTSIDPTTGGLARNRCPEETSAPFIAGTEPTEECAEHRSWWSRLFE